MNNTQVSTRSTFPTTLSLQDWPFRVFFHAMLTSSASFVLPHWALPDWSLLFHTWTLKAHQSPWKQRNTCISANYTIRMITPRHLFVRADSWRDESSCLESGIWNLKKTCWCFVVWIQTGRPSGHKTLRSNKNLPIPTNVMNFWRRDKAQEAGWKQRKTHTHLKVQHHDNPNLFFSSILNIACMTEKQDTRYNKLAGLAATKN